MHAIVETAEHTSLDHASPEVLLQWAWQNHGDRAAIFTSFQNTGCVIIDIAHRVAPNLRVVTVDTLRLPHETYEVMDALEQKYGIRIERFTPNPQRLEKMIRDHGEYLFFDTQEKQQHCCAIRKVEPNKRALATVDVWITGLRRDQSKARQVTPKVAEVEQGGHTLIKLCPLIEWTEQAIADYIVEHDVPYNRLYDRGYTSLGCVICSTPTRPGEDRRAGRWRWWNHLNRENHKECGIHVAGSGI